MEIQKETKIDEFRIELSKESSKQFEEKQEDAQYFIIDEKKAELKINEFYFDGDKFYFAGMDDTKGLYVSFEIPISKEILVDFMTYNIRKMNKIKTVLENLD